MDIRELDPRDEALVRRHWEIGVAAEAHRPYAFPVPWEVARRTALHGHADRDRVLLGAFSEGEMWGAGDVETHRLDNPHLAAASYAVHPDRQRRGLGRALVEASFEVVRRTGRRLVMTEAYAPLDEDSPGVQFATSLGFATALVDGMKVVDLLETEPSWDAIEAASAARHEGYRTLTWVDHVPDDLVEGFCRLNEMFFSETPTGDLEVEDEHWDVERVRAREAGNLARGRTDYCVGAVAPDGTLAAYTEVGVLGADTSYGSQSGTIVAPEHRGRALALAVKLANHRQLRRELPGLRLLLTGNADVNAAMNAVNDRLGYREVERCVGLQRPV